MLSPKWSVTGYVVFVASLASALFALFVWEWGAPRPGDVVLFWLLYVAGDKLELERPVHGIPRAGLRQLHPSLTTGILVLLVCSFATDPPTAGLVGLLTPLVPGGWRGTIRAVFNGSQFLLCASIASWAFHFALGTVGDSAVGVLLGGASGALLVVVLNTVLVSLVLAIERERKPVDLLRELAWPAPTSLAFGMLALFVAVIYDASGAAAAVLVLVPLFLLRRTRQGKLELETTRLTTLRAFVRAVELKDPYTSRHSERVAEIAAHLHRALGAKEEEVTQRYYAALLHDIGKVAVSGRILGKAGPLTEEEFEAVKRHPTIGAMVLADVDFLYPFIDEVLHHHERLDGQGYPSGLKAEGIPFFARVLAVADTFEALTSDRPYRSALSERAALEEMRRCSGSQLDPEVVEVLAAMVVDGALVPALPTKPSPVPADEEERAVREA